MNAFSYVVAITIILLNAACSTDPVKHRGSLSDAMDKASDSYHEPRVIEPTYDESNFREDDETKVSFLTYLFSGSSVPQESMQEESDASSSEVSLNQDFDSRTMQVSPDPLIVDSDIRAKSDILMPDEKTEDYEMVYSLRYGRVSLANAKFNSFRFAELGLGVFTNDNFRAQLLFSGASLTPTEGNDSIKHQADLFRLGGEMSWPALKGSSSKFFQPYMKFGGAMSLLSWKYKNSIYDPVYDEHIFSDRITGVEFTVGLGVSLVANNKTNLSVELAPSVMFWNEYTDEGFDNDYFTPFGMIKMSADLSF